METDFLPGMTSNFPGQYPWNTGDPSACRDFYQLYQLSQVRQAARERHSLPARRLGPKRILKMSMSDVSAIRTSPAQASVPV